MYNISICDTTKPVCLWSHFWIHKYIQPQKDRLIVHIYASKPSIAPVSNMFKHAVLDIQELLFLPVLDTGQGMDMYTLLLITHLWISGFLWDLIGGLQSILSWGLKHCVRLQLPEYCSHHRYCIFWLEYHWNCSSKIYNSHPCSKRCYTFHTIAVFLHLCTWEALKCVCVCECEVPNRYSGMMGNSDALSPPFWSDPYGRLCSFCWHQEESSHWHQQKLCFHSKEWEAA